MRRAAAGLALVVALVGCGERAYGPFEVDEILVFAASSLTETFHKIGNRFHKSGSALSGVRFHFASSSNLATLIANGAHADVFASASPMWMDAVERDPGVLERVEFAKNKLIVIVPKSNPADIDSFDDLTRPGVKLVLAAQAVPAGQYARQALKKAGLVSAERNVASNEEDVKGVVQKVLLGEADAGIVYATDVTGSVAEQVAVVSIPDDVNVIASYSIASIKTSEDLMAATAFLDFVLEQGRPYLRRAGFLDP
ncbi:MAG: molybdate ABC transporter substrate-binding protein [Actinomycetota bacterium]